MRYLASHETNKNSNKKKIERLMNPLISIIVPCYNQSQYMRETLDCLKKQTIEEWECIIVNDGSTDNTLEIAKEYVKSDNHYVLVDKPNGGLADARNAGIKASHGKYILPLDSDDLIASTYAEKAVSYLEEHPETTLVYCKAKYFGDRDEEWNLPEYDFDKLLFCNQIFCSCVYRRCDYDRTEGYNTNMKHGLEDWNFLLSLLNKESKVYRIPEILFFYRKHGVSMIANTNKHTKELYCRIVANHIDLYYPYLYHAIITQGEIEYLRGELNGILNSNAYKLGNTLIKPFRWLKAILSLEKQSG